MARPGEGGRSDIARPPRLPATDPPSAIPVPTHFDSLGAFSFWILHRAVIGYSGSGLPTAEALRRSWDFRSPRFSTLARFPRETALGARRLRGKGWTHLRRRWQCYPVADGKTGERLFPSLPLLCKFAFLGKQTNSLGQVGKCAPPRTDRPRGAAVRLHRRVSPRSPTARTDELGTPRIPDLGRYCGWAMSLSTEGDRPTGGRGQKILIAR
jgi:hypothetical protein